jgi:hypothetical protein
MRAIALWRMRVAMMKLTGSKAALALRRWCEAAEMQAAQTAAIDRLCCLPVSFDVHPA